MTHRIKRSASLGLDHGLAGGLGLGTLDLEQDPDQGNVKGQEVTRTETRIR